ncbi:MAG TPA: zf-HC2 domain-containing protein [Thermoanaerobaculia bacterium]|nr:zf-HC2 domain-containing protein [Thermoanaerobaculia bacterium]
MTAAVSVMNHPTDNALAAFVDGTLPPPERQEVIKHMADCAECRDTVLLTTEIAEAEAPAKVAASTVVPWRPKRWLPLAAAAAIVVVVVGITQRQGDPMRPIAHALQEMSERPMKARVSVDAPYRHSKPVLRGDEKSDDYRALSALAEAQDNAAKSGTVENLHALGVAQLIAGNRAEAVETLESVKVMVSNPSAELLSDLAAAYLAYGDNQKALEYANRAWNLEPAPAAAWNRALALEYLNDTAAKPAWEAYLKLDPDSAWAKEVRTEHLSDRK